MTYRTDITKAIANVKRRKPTNTLNRNIMLQSHAIDIGKKYKKSFQSVMNILTERYNSTIKSVPRGYTKTIGATTSPRGYCYYNNGKSRFSGKRKSVLVKVKK
jgi:hypothetical protein